MLERTDDGRYRVGLPLRTIVTDEPCTSTVRERGPRAIDDLDGVLLEILVSAGETVPVGAPLTRIGEPRPVPATGAPVTNGSAAPAASEAGRMLSPLVRRLVAEAGLDVAAIRGTGAGGRIRREDVEKAVASGAAAPVAAPAAAAVAASPPVPAAVAAPKSPTDPRDEVVALSKMRLAVAAG